MSGSSDRFSEAPISQLVGFDVQPGDVGEATVQIQSGRQHHNPMGRVHGGLISALADAAMGIAFGRTLLDEEDFSTIEMKVNFIRPVRDGLLVAHAKVVERGLRIGFVECEIFNAKRKRVATASSTCTVISER
ncbi:MAG: PaaI family thioesterase [Planctomycetota bacterium]